MKRKFTFLITAAVMLLTMMATTAMWGQTRTEEVAYTLQPASGSNNGYANNCDITISGITWNLTGNSTVQPWRIGGKSLNGIDRTLYSKTAISDNITKIEVTHGAASSITINSWTVIVASDASFNTIVSTLTPTFTANSTTTINRPENTDWSGCYYKFVYNVTVSVSSNKFLEFSQAKFYKEVSGNTPYIDADDVEIAYNATNGSIGYTLNNATGNVTANVTTGEDWLTLGTVTSNAVPFTCSANEAAAARTATVTLSFNGASNKVITITQAGNPNVVNNIEDITAAGNYTVKGTIVAMSTRGFVLGDGTGYVYYYYGNNFSTTYTIGDVVKLSGDVTASSSYKVFQFTSSATITAATESNYVAEDPTVISGADMDAQVASTAAVSLSNYIQYQGTLTVNNTFYNITSIDGATTAKGSISYPTNTDFTSLNGKVVTVTGYYVGVSSNQYYNTMIGSIEEVETEVEAPSFSPAAGTYAEAQTVTMSCTTAGAAIHYTTDGTEPDGNSTQYTEPISVSTTTTFKAKAIKGDDASAVITATYHICSAESPYTVAQASSYTPATGTSSNVYIHGIVSAFYNTSIVGDGNNYRYYISDDGTTTNQILVYKGKGLNETTFTNADDLLVGDIVTIYGGLTTYSNAPEIVSGNYLVAWERPTIPSISAEDVALTYDATSGTIYYEIENYIAGTMTASTEADWISDFTYDQANEIGEVGFTTTANDGAARQATVTLTYTYNTNQTVTKNVTVSQAAAPVPSITVDPATVNAPTAGETSTLALTYQDITISEANDFDIQFYDGEQNELNGENEPDWLIVVVEAGQTSGYVVSYTIDENTGDARAAYFKVYASGPQDYVYSNLVTINQAAGSTPPTPGQYDWVATTLANLTSDDVFVIVGDNGDTYAMSNDNGSSAPTAEAVTIENGAITGTVADNIQWNLSTSDDGYMFYPNGTTETWLYCTNTNNGVKVGTGDAKHFTLSDNGYITTSETTDQRYIGIYNSQDWRCYTSEGGNIANQTFAFYKRVPASTEPSITLNQYTYDLNADGGNAVIPVTTANLATTPNLAVVFYESDGTTTTTYDWISATINGNGNIAGHIDENEGAARTAYFKVSGLANDNTTTVYSDLVTINQAAATAPSIVFETASMSLVAGGEQDRKLSFDYAGLGSTPTFTINYYESDGTTATTAATYNWLTASIDENNKLNITAVANTGEARSAYLKVYGVKNENVHAESNLVTINQAAYVAPTYTVTYNANGGTGTMTDPNSPYTANTQVTLLENTFTAPEGKIWDAWLVKDANQTTIDVNNNTFTMPASNVTVTAQWVDNPVVPTYEWVLTALEDLTSSDVFVIVGTRTDEDYAGNYAMSNDNGATNPPTASAVTITNNKLSAAPANNLKWNISGNATDGYILYPNGSTTTWLYCTADNNGVRVGTNANKTFKVEDGYLKNDATSRFVGVYQNKDWRCYTSHTGSNNNIKDQTFSYFKRQVSSTDPHLYTNDVDIECDETEGEITYTLENAVQGGELTAEITAGNEGGWLTLGAVGATVPFTCEPNTEQTERTATVTLTYTYNAKATVTATAVVTQAALIVDYATMPFAFDGGRDDIENVNGLTQEGLDTDYGSSPKLKFNTTNDWMILKLNEAPKSIIYDIKGNSFSGGTFKVQVSEDGVDYDDLEVYDELGDVQTDTIINTNDDVRYIKWIYTTKSSGNVALGNIQVYDVEFTIINNSQIIDNLTIGDGEAIVVNPDVVLELTGTVTNPDPANLIIREGGQLKTESDVQATLQKEVAAYTARDGDGWYLIATPVETLPKSVVAGTTYDLFLYDEHDAMWYAHWDNPGFDNIVRGKGYLYANAEDKTINYEGLMKATNSNINIPLDYTSTLSDAVRGFNLVGNPFTRNLKLGDMKLGGAALTTFYVMNNDRTGLQAITSDAYEIKPGEGFFVQATATSQQLSFNTPSSKDEIDFRYIKIVAGNEAGYDNTYIQFGECNTLRKMNIANKTEVYVMDGEDDYAAARVEELAGSMPVHFKAIADGEYTITIEAKYTDVHYMHLIDNFTGEDIDLMLEPSYTFQASANDSENRFLIVFDLNNYAGVNENYSDEIFAYQYGSEIIVNGEGELQIFDVMGRMVATQHVNGVQTINVKLQGVYIFRLNDKTQKIIVR